MNGWDRAIELTEKNAAGLYLRFKGHGEKALLVFVREPSAGEFHWSGGEYVECTGEHCPLCAKNHKASTRVKINVYLMSEKTMKIWELSGKTCREIADLREKYPLEKWCFEVKRNGAANDTNTVYRILPERELTQEERKAIAAAPVHDLDGPRDSQHDDETKDPPSPRRVDPDAKISPQVVAEFRERIKRLPLTLEERKRAYYTILGAFGCERPDDLTVAQEHRARSLIERAERGEPIAPPPAASQDPFDDFP